MDHLHEAQQEEGEPEEELEYVDAPAEPIPRQPIAPDPPLQRRRATYDRRPSRGPPPPRRIVLPAPLSQAQPVAPLPPHPQPYVYNHPSQQAQQVQDDNDDPGFDNDTEVNEDSPLLGLPQSERNRPHRSRTQSSGVIGISVEPPVRIFPSVHTHYHLIRWGLPVARELPALVRE